MPLLGGTSLPFPTSLPSSRDTKHETIPSSLPRPQQKAQPPPQHNHHTDENPRQFEYSHFIPLLRHPTQAARGAFYGARHGGKDFGLEA